MEDIELHQRVRQVRRARLEGQKTKGKNDFNSFWGNLKLRRAINKKS